MARQPPTMILSHATVRTMDPHQPRAEAVALRHGRIVAVGSDAEVLPLRSHGTTIISSQGAALLPGFIDAHVHVESSHMLPHRYAEVVVPQGTTTIFWDPHELANVLGLDGIRYAVEASRKLPLRFIVQASSCVPAAPGLEISGADFKADEIRELMSWPDIAALAEVMDMRAVLEAQPRCVAAGACATIAMLMPVSEALAFLRGQGVQFLAVAADGRVYRS